MKVILKGESEGHPFRGNQYGDAMAAGYAGSQAESVRDAGKSEPSGNLSGTASQVIQGKVTIDIRPMETFPNGKTRVMARWTHADYPGLSDYASGPTREAAIKDAMKTAKMFDTPTGRATLAAAQAMSSTSSNPKEASHIMYRASKNGVTLQDKGGFFGHTSAYINANELKHYKFTVDEFVSALAAGGATKIPNQRRNPSYSLYD